MLKRGFVAVWGGCEAPTMLTLLFGMLGGLPCF